MAVVKMIFHSFHQSSTIVRALSKFCSIFVQSIEFGPNWFMLRSEFRGAGMDTCNLKSVTLCLSFQPISFELTFINCLITADMNSNIYRNVARKKST